MPSQEKPGRLRLAASTNRTCEIGLTAETGITTARSPICSACSRREETITR
jgi:hypothetical protein